jgi:hypothetical protein
MQATKQWRTYLAGRKFTIYTDHMPLRYLRNKEHLPHRHADYLDWLSMFDFEVHYKPGKLNRVADALSRREDLKELNAILALETDEARMAQIVQGYNDDPYFTGVKSFFSGGGNIEIPHKRRLKRQFRLDERGILYEMRGREPRVCIPRGTLRKQIIKDAHDAPISGHFGIEKTVAQVQRHYWWPTIRKEVTQYVRTCLACQRNKPSQQSPAGLLQPLPVPDGRWSDVTMDLITSLPETPRGHDAIIVFVDRLTKRAHFAPTRTDASSYDIARLFLHNVVRLHGLPQRIVCDRDRRFINMFWQELMKLLGTELRPSTAYHPQTDGQSERTNRTLLQMLRPYVNHHQDDWDEWLDSIEIAYNNMEQDSIHTTPYYCDLGRHPRMPNMLITQCDVREVTNVEAAAALAERMQAITAEAQAAIGQAQQMQEYYANLKRRGETFEVGDQVMLSTEHALPDALRIRPTRKFTPRYSGPYTITKKISDVVYVLDLPENMHIHPVFHISKLKRFHRREGEPNADEQMPPPIIVDDHEEWEVEEILAKRKTKKGIEYLIKWAGYPEEASSWQPIRNVVNAPEKVREFEEKNAARRGRRVSRRGRVVRSSRRAAKDRR